MNALPRVAVLNAPGQGPWPGFEVLEGEAEIAHAEDEASLASALRGAEILVVTDIRTRLLGHALERADALTWIHATSAGVDAIMIPELVASELMVTNARGVFDHAIAETVMGMILAFAKDLRGTFELQKERRWVHRETERIRGQRLLVVGAGSIGREIGRYGRGLGLIPSGVAGRARAGDPVFGDVGGPDDLNELLPSADWVAIAAPLTRTTRGLVGRAALERMKTSARLINVGRGAIVDTEALIAALEESQIAGAALDVFEEEPLPADHPLWRAPSAIVTAHMAGDFFGWRRALTEQFATLFRSWRAGAPLANVVDKRSTAS